MGLVRLVQWIGIESMTAQYDFCTYFDHRYLSRGLVLYRSLSKHCAGFRLWVLALDQIAYEALDRLKLPQLRLITLEELERADSDLLRVKPDRSRIEYYFTCTPFLISHIIKEFHDVSLITYLDSDLFFFDDPAPIYSEMSDRSIAIIEHRFPPRLSELERLGKYNVGWVSFRRDPNGQACLEWWRERCLEWCYDRLEEGRFADQKYLDVWPATFKGVAVIQYRGADVAPWNVDSSDIVASAAGVRVDGDSLLFFHFHGFRQLTWHVYDPNFHWYGATLTCVIRNGIVRPYIAALDGAKRDLRPLLRDVSHTRGIRFDSRFSSELPRRVRMRRAAGDLVRMGKALVAGRLVLT